MPMDTRYESIEELAISLEMPKLLVMSTKGMTSEDVATMKYKQAETHGITADEFVLLKSYFKSNSVILPRPLISRSPKRINRTKKLQ